MAGVRKAVGEISVDHLVCKVYIDKSLSEDPSVFEVFILEIKGEETVLEYYSGLYGCIKGHFGPDVVPGTLTLSGKTVLTARDFLSKHWRGVRRQRGRRTLRDWNLKSGDVLHWIPFESVEAGMREMRALDELEEQDSS